MGENNQGSIHSKATEPEKMAKHGYRIGIDDMEPEVGKMIESGFMSSH